MKGLLLDKDGDIRIAPNTATDGKLTGFAVGDTLIQNAAIAVSYTHLDVYKRQVEFTDNGVDVKQGDKSIATQFTLLPSHIDWNVAM